MASLSPSRQALRNLALPQSIPDTGADPYADWSLDQMKNYFEQYPGAAPRGTGETGLASDDATGYSHLLNMRQRFLQMGGK